MESTPAKVADALRQLSTDIQNAQPEQLSAQQLSAWAEQLTQAATSLSAASSVPPLSPLPPLPALTHSKSGGAHSFSCGTSSRPTYVEGSAAPDRGVLEERLRVTSSSGTLTQQSMQDLSLCIMSVLDAVLEETRCDEISLCVPYRGMHDEFRCLCAMSRASNRLLVGSGIVRGTHTLEYSCYNTGYLIHAGSRAAFFTEDGITKDCTTFLEFMDKPTTGKEIKPPPPHRSTKKKGDFVRICCPVKLSATAKPIGVITLIRKGAEPLAPDMENFVYDAASIVGSLLHRCQDYTALQVCFAKGGLRERLPPALPLPAVDMPEHRQQLVYRVQLHPDDVGAALRVSSGAANTVKLSENTPIETVFHYMQRIQNSWSSAVQLNVQLKRICDEKEEQLYALMTRARIVDANKQQQQQTAPAPVMATDAAAAAVVDRKTPPTTTKPSARSEKK